MRRPVVCLAALFAALALPVSAQVAAKVAAPKAIPRMPGGKPDLQGVWQHPYVPDMSQDRQDQKGPGGALPFTPWGEDNFKNYDVSKFDYTGHCLPFGLLRSMN